jgi:phosphotransferase system IIB component
MQQVQLYIGNQRVELFKDETISLTESIQNVKDVAKVFTDFTKTFTVPASKTNNKIFKHYYNFDIVGGFDARLKTSGSIKLNGVDFKKGNIKLEGVDLKNNKPNAYRVTFFGDLSDLKDLIGEDLLSDLDWLDNFEKEYSTANVKDNLKGGNTDFTIDSVTYAGAIKTPLISCVNRLYYNSTANTETDGNLWYHTGGGQVHEHGVYWKDLKYSIAVYVIVKAIEEKYGITFSDDFFTYTNTAYSSLMMLMHRKKGEAEADYSTGVILYQREVVDFNQIGAIWSATVNSNNYTIAGSYNGFTASGSFGAATQVYYDYVITFNPADNNIPYNIYLYFTSDATGVKTLIEEVEGATGSTSVGGLGDDNFSAVGEYSIVVEAAETLNFPSGDIEVDARITYQGSTVGSGSPKATLSANTIEEKFAWLPTQQLPKMKVLDFLTGLWKLWNLTAYVEDDGTIKVQTLDSFYSGGTDYDITKYVDVNSSSVNIALPYKQINFRFKGHKTLLASKFEQLQNREFATLEYKGENPSNWVGQEYKVEVPFEKMVYERLTDDNTLETKNIMYGFMADDNQEPYIGEPLLHYASLQNPTQNGAGISFRDTTTSHSQITVSIFMPTNQRNFQINTGQESINFYSELNEWTATTNDNSLFEERYKEYIQDVFNEKRRLTKVKAFLPLKIILKHTLADRFVIAGKKYKINSITTNLQTGESDIELLNEV